MSLTKKPYLPLYVQDFMTDEKLIECSASSTGIYIRLMCIMHKSEQYGVILLKQKDKQTDNTVMNFAIKLARQMPYKIDEIYEGLNELLDQNVVFLDEDKLCQKRMMRDDYISETRAKAGRKGAKNKKDFAKAKTSANSDNDNDNNNNKIKEIGVEGEEEKIEPNVFSVFEENFGRPLSPIEYEIINGWQNENFSNELILYALKKAILSQAYNFKYIDTILQSYKKKNIKTICEAVNDDEKFQLNKNKNVTAPPSWLDQTICDTEPDEIEEYQLNALKEKYQGNK